MESIKYNELSEEQRRELQNVYQNIDKIWDFSCKANEKLFIHIFGEKMGLHYWEKFSTAPGRDILYFMCGMDSDKKGDLIANIFLDKSLYTKTL
jgi:hypothetical protein